MPIEQVQQFKYLGVVLDDKGKQDLDIKERIEKATKAYYSMCSTIIKKKEISKKTKMLVYKTIFQPILLFGSETWTMSNNMKSRVQAVEMKYLRAVKGVTRRDHIRNQEVREELEVKSAMETVEERQLGWWGHLQRLDNDRPVKKIWEARTLKKRRRGRPKETWNNIIAKTLEKKKTSWQEAKMLSSNKKEWRMFVQSA